jgi:hypothetical protein
MTAVKHTPLRLELKNGYATIYEAYGRPTCIMDVDLNSDPSVGVIDTSERDAAFLAHIVQCVNAHDELVKALERAKEQLDPDCFTSESREACLARINRLLDPVIKGRYAAAHHGTGFLPKKLEQMGSKK